MKTSTPSPVARATRPIRMLVLTLLLSVAGGVVQTTQAAPGMGGMGGPAAMGQHGDRWGMGGPGMGDPRMMGRMLDSINATPDQRAQIQKIVAAAQADMRAQHEQGQALRQQGQAVFAQPNVDANAVEAVRRQMLAQHDQASKRKMQVMLDISRVLTPEQRKTMADRMNQRRAMMERHRSERDSLEKPMMK